ncbi:TetR/AcrR family transcriptional regulator [Galbibacter sp. EGI 63066]|uniref:TetR/AcrR family transcriptional regulator n=1 Tax=Galbibacter sp. EGI 63066 TaxID=2993559 RepID=UPI0022492FF0|nr:TetR/AcrR family transcriptional regulator [Galbibacter sp. EGI 63066]MCX2681397.1 TetR/AcrR family transcriptional regulator [Galbibacter sp. EGI 63066]
MTTSVKHKEKSDYLLEKGLDILWHKGYNGTSVNDIVKAADVPKGSFYFYFDSKEDFAVKALERYYELKRVDTADCLDELGVKAVDRIYGYYELRVNIMKDQLQCKHGCMACNIGNEMAEHSEKIRKVIVNFQDRVRAHITSIVTQAQENGEIKSDLYPENIVDFMEDAYKGMLTSMKESQSPEPLDNFLYFLKHMILT